MKVLIFSPKSEDQAFVSVFETTKHRQSWLLKTQKQRRSVFKKENTFLQTMESEIFLHATHYLAGNFKTGFILNSSNTPQTFFYLFSKEWPSGSKKTSETRRKWACFMHVPHQKRKSLPFSHFFRKVHFWCNFYQVCGRQEESRRLELLPEVYSSYLISD